MRYLGAADMLWLAGRIALAGPVREGESRGAPLGFFGAAAFQWVNPKGWVIAISALTAYSVVDDYARNVLIVALAYLADRPAQQRLVGAARLGDAPRSGRPAELRARST